MQVDYFKDLLVPDNAYPIAATVFVLMPKAASPVRTRATLDFFQWSLDKGSQTAAQLG